MVVIVIVMIGSWRLASLSFTPFVALQEVDMSKPTCILLGNEAQGLTQEA